MAHNKLLNRLSILFLAMVISGCATIPKQPPISGKKEAYLKDVCSRNNISWQWDQVSQVVTLKYQGARAKAAELLAILHSSVELWGC